MAVKRITIKEIKEASGEAGSHQSNCSIRCCAGEFGCHCKVEVARKHYDLLLKLAELWEGLAGQVESIETSGGGGSDGNTASSVVARCRNGGATEGKALAKAMELLRLPAHFYPEGPWRVFWSHLDNSWAITDDKGKSIVIYRKPDAEWTRDELNLAWIERKGKA